MLTVLDSPQQEKEPHPAVLRATVERYLPAFAKVVALVAARPKDEKGHCGAAPGRLRRGYDDDEYTLLGMAVKYAGCTELSSR